jgi:ferredoxin
VGSNHCHRVVLHLPDGSLKELSVDESQHIWDAAHAVGIDLPSICNQGRCLTCAGRLLQPGEFDASDAVRYFPEDRTSGFILLCTACPRSDLEILTHSSRPCANIGAKWACLHHIQESTMQDKRDLPPPSAGCSPIS